jgi:peptidoglycan/xylan/chitin deacetylase (PgdA/CDA1 family)
MTTHSAGHELANHGAEDIAYHYHTAEDFRAALHACERKIQDIYSSSGPHSGVGEPARVKWFRPPHGRCSDAMLRVLEQEGYTLALCDAFGMDTVCGAPYVARHILRHARGGSVVLMHMPERGFREHNLAAMDTVLAGLARRGLRCRTLSELAALAAGPAPRRQPPSEPS